jgi:hypothetical protein
MEMRGALQSALHLSSIGVYRSSLNFILKKILL